MTNFHNPYHFVPLKAKENKGQKHWTDATPYHGTNRSLNPYFEAGHSRYAKGRHHGRITCTLTTETPIFIGANRYRPGSDSEPACVAPYELGGQPAIPATSLRGMISSIAEAASYSAMRVLEDRALSKRKSHYKALSALGLIEKIDEEGATLVPIACPVLKTDKLPCDRPRHNRQFTEEGQLRLPERFENIFNPNLPLPIKIYFNGAKDADGKRLETFNGTGPFYYMDVDLIYMNNLPFSNNNQFKIRGDKKECIKLGLYQKGFNRHKSLKREGEKNIGVRGIVRYFKPRVGTKRHQYFIPYTVDHEKHQKRLTVPKHVVQNFKLLADERSESDETLPNTPMPREKWKKKPLSEGDIVFFDVNDSGEVNELSFSAIWRDRPTRKDRTLATLFDFLQDSEILPFNEARFCLSPAERVFGFVEDRPHGGNDSKHQAATYAGHVQFSTARMEGLIPTDAYMEEVTLKILDSPKPPSPALYFRNKSGESSYIDKQDLNPDAHQPQGRKFYLHHRNQDTKSVRECGGKNRLWWETCFDEHTHYQNDKQRKTNGRLKQKTRITPLREGLSFSFHIDFDNLSDYELGMLLYALCPNDKFQHKIGMGKPLGLGSVSLKIGRLEISDRVQRYLIDGPFSAKGKDRSVKDCKYFKDGKYFKDCKYFRDEFRGTMMKIAPAAIKALETLGDPEKVKYPVHYPQTANANGAAFERENFKWWVNNEKADAKSKQHLKPLDQSNFQLSPLKRN